MKTFGGHERSAADGGMERVVVSELGVGNLSGPVGLQPVPPFAQVKLDELIGAFGLAISLRVKGGGELNINAQPKADLSPDCIDELRASIGGDGIRGTVLAVVFGEPRAAHADRVDFLDRVEECVFGEAVDNHHDIGAFLPVGIEEWRQAGYDVEEWRQAGYEVHGDVFPTSLGDG